MANKEIKQLLSLAKQEKAHQFKELFSKVLKDRIVNRINDERQRLFTEEYNGWTNYETWNVMLWLNNDEPSYRRMMEFIKRTPNITAENARKFVMSVFPNGTRDMKDAGQMNQVNWNEIADHWKEDKSELGESKKKIGEGRAGEKSFFKRKHPVKKHDHPVASDDNFTGGTTRAGSRLADQDTDVQGDEDEEDNSWAAMKDVDPYSGEEVEDEDEFDDVKDRRDFDVGAM